MQSQIKHTPAREMHKYVFGLIGVFSLFVVTFSIACLRVSQDKKFADVKFHVKSLTVEGKLPNASGESVAVQPSANSSTEKIVQPPVVADASQSAQTVNPTVTNSSTEKTVQPPVVADATQTVANNLSAQTFISGSTDQTVQTEQVGVNPNSPTAEITDPVQIKELNQKVYDKIAQVWRSGRRFKQALAYRVTVTEDGAIASYEALVQPALDSVQETPLPSLIASSVNQAKTSTRKALGQYKVVFTHRGILEVSPWNGWKSR